MKLRKSKLVCGIRSAAKRLRANATYSWGHPGSCNCGHLIQSLTTLTHRQIRQAAYHKGGEWKDLGRTHCETSGLEVDKIIKILFSFGLNVEDIIHLENLSDPKILKKMPIDSSSVRRNNRMHLIYYLESWANILDNKSVGSRESKTIEHTTDIKFGQADKNLIFSNSTKALG